MARPTRPKLISRHSDKRNYSIQETNEMYVILFDEKYFSECATDAFDDKTPKYKVMAFLSEGTAFNKCNKLNEQYSDNRFTVHKISSTIPIEISPEVVKSKEYNALRKEKLVEKRREKLRRKITVIDLTKK